MNAEFDPRVNSLRTARNWRRWRVGALVFINVAVVMLLVTLLLTDRGPPPRDSGPLPTLGGLTSVSRIEPLFSRVAGQLVGHKIEVRCWSARDWARLSHEASVFTHGSTRLGPWSGYAAFDHKLVNLSPRVCRRLGLLAYRGLGMETYAESYRLAWSLQVLAVHAYQLARTRNGVKAECYAMQSIAATATSLGLDRTDAAALARLYWRRIYLELQPQYRSDECVNGGKLDLRPNSRAWPTAAAASAGVVVEDGADLCAPRLRRRPSREDECHPLKGLFFA